MARATGVFLAGPRGVSSKRNEFHPYCLGSFILVCTVVVVCHFSFSLLLQKVCSFLRNNKSHSALVYNESSHRSPTTKRKAMRWFYYTLRLMWFGRLLIIFSFLLRSMTNRRAACWHDSCQTRWLASPLRRCVVCMVVLVESNRRIAE